MPELPPGLAGGLLGGAAEVAVGFVEADDLFGRASDGDGVWNDYQIVSAYEQDRRTYLLPLCHPQGYRGQTAAFVQLAAPTLVWAADWTAAKMGAFPEVPNPHLVSIIAVQQGIIGGLLGG